MADALHTWLLAQRVHTTEGTALARALDYGLKRWAEIARSKVKVAVTPESETAPASPLRADVIALIKAVSAEMWLGVSVFQTMGVSTTDSRHFRVAGIPMCVVSGLFADPVKTGVHGMNERFWCGICMTGGNSCTGSSKD